VRAPSLAFLRTQSDQRLLRLARNGHERAFEAIVERYRKPLQREARRVLPEARAEDAVQHAFMAAWTALRRGDEVRELRPWLYRIGFNSALNVARAPGFDYDELEESLRLAEAPQDELERRAVMRRTLAGIAALPERQREALLRTAVEGTSQEEIARDLGLTNGAVRQLVHRARMSLRAAVTAVTPLPLVTWLASGGARPEPMAQRIAELAAGGAGVGVAATAAKVGTAVVVAGGAISGPVALDNQEARPRAAAPVEREAKVRNKPDRAPVRPAVVAAAPSVTAAAPSVTAAASPVTAAAPPASDPPARRPSAPRDRAAATPDRERPVRREREREVPLPAVEEDVDEPERDREWEHRERDSDDEERPLARREHGEADEEDVEERPTAPVAPPREEHAEDEDLAEPETPEFRHEPAEEPDEDDHKEEESQDSD
jgi:RNA polymerase sigma factor (sigma-70 family)